jgi:hypothetical protein
MATRKPRVGKPGSLSGFSLSRTLPPLRLPRSSSLHVKPRPRPQIGRPLPGQVSSPSTTLPPTAVAADLTGCHRCHHSEEQHPVRYVCDKYPHPDPLQLCGCERETLDEVCPGCGHKGRSHKPRHRCRAEGCHCWGFEGE